MNVLREGVTLRTSTQRHAFTRSGVGWGGVGRDGLVSVEEIRGTSGPDATAGRCGLLSRSVIKMSLFR